MKLSQQIKAAVRRSMLASIPVNHRGPRIEFRLTDKVEDDIGVQLVNPTEVEFFCAVASEPELIVVYI